MPAPFPSDQFTIEEVADRVWAAIAIPGASSSSNCGIVDLGYATLIFDTSHTPQAAHDLWTAARLCTGKDPSIVVNSHWHFDHTFGNPAFRGATFFGTRITRERLLAFGTRFADGIGEPDWIRETDAMQATLGATTEPLARDALTAKLAARRELGLVPRGEMILVPSSNFEGRHRFPGPRGVQVVEGGGHSESDSVLFLEDTEVLFAGDLVSVGTHPEMAGGSLPRWTTTLGRIEAIGAKVIVPGHGPVGTPAACDELRTYFERMEARAEQAGPVPMPEPYTTWRSPARFEENLAFVRSGGLAGPSESTGPSNGGLKRR
ncbi:MAG: MBL fold metallo-hydrolase [Candidatus Lutacidiplasmatales archaeon]